MYWLADFIRDYNIKIRKVSFDSSVSRKID